MFSPRACLPQAGGVYPANGGAPAFLLPADTPWALRDERTAAYLDDGAAIGDVMTNDEGTEPAVVVTPKAHLGGVGG